LDGIATSQKISFVAAHFSITSSVCQFVVCHICALCLNRSMDLERCHLAGISLGYVLGPMTHCVRWAF